MSFNLVDFVKDNVGKEIAGALASNLGADTEDIDKSLDSAIPALLGGLVSKGSDEKGATDFLDFVKDQDFDHLLSGKADDLLSNGAKSSEISKSGLGALGFLFGGESKVSNLINTFGKVSGMGASSGGGMLKMLAPFVMSSIGKYAKSKALNASGLSSFFVSQQDAVAKAMPSEFGSEMGFAHGISGSASAASAGHISSGHAASRSVESKVETAYVPPAKKEGAGIMKFLPIILGLLGLLFLFNMFMGKNKGQEYDALSGDIVKYTPPGEELDILEAETTQQAASVTGSADPAGIANSADTIAKEETMIESAGSEESGESAVLEETRIEEIVPDIADGRASAADKAASVSQQGAQAVNGAASGLANGIAGAAGSVTEGARDLASGATKMLSDTTGAISNTVGEATAGVTGTIGSLTLPGGSVIEAPKGSFTDSVVSYLGSGEQRAGTERAFNFDRVNFETGSSTLTSDSNSQINNLASILSAYPNIAIRVEGHTDNTGNAQANLQLSSKRAEQVRNYLMTKGIDSVRVAAVGLGQNSPVADNSTTEGRAENRRVSVVLMNRN